MKKIIISAQWFWWGPVSKAFSIINEFKNKNNNNIKVIFIWVNKLSNFVEKNSENIDEIIYINNYRDIDKYIKKINPSYTISIMEPYLVYYSYLNNIKAYLIDSLTSFWDWEWINSFKAQKMNIDTIDPHMKQYLWYSFASKIFIQNLPWGKDYNDIFKNKLINSGYIIDNPNISLKKTKKIIISFCWLLSPVVDLDKATIYIDFCMTILYDSLVEFTNYWYEINIVWHPDILWNINTDFKNINIDFYSKEDYLKLLNESYLLIWPASLTSVFESLWNNTPYVILPEQHDWHLANYNILNNKNDVFKGKLLSTYNSNLNNIKENSVLLIYETIKKLLLNNDSIWDFSKYYFNTIKYLLLNRNHSEYFENQKLALDFDNKKNGVKYIVNKIIKYEN